MREMEIRLEGVRLFGRHGVFEQERKEGNDFEVDLRVSYEVEGEESSDEIYDTISYAVLYDIVKKEMETPRNLLETVARAIVKAIRGRYPESTSIECRVAKLRPPIPDFEGVAAVVYREQT